MSTICCCYTPNGQAGIKVVEFNNQTGQLNRLSELPNASFLAVSKNKKYLLADSEDEVAG